MSEHQRVKEGGADFGATSPVINLSSSDGKGKKKGVVYEEWSESNSPNKINKIGADMVDIKQTVSVMFKYLANQNPFLSNQTASPLKPEQIVTKMFSPPSVKNLSEEKLLRTVQSPIGYYIGQPAKTIESPAKLLNQTSPFPWWLLTQFKLVNELQMTSEEIWLAGFLFGRSAGDNLDPEETLVRTNDGSFFATRRIIRQLLPGKMIDDDQNAHNWSMKTCKFIEQYGTQFMGTGVCLEKIPMNEDNIHWFLIVVDVPHKEIILLDSLPPSEKVESRLKKVRKVALYVEDMLEDKFFVGLMTQPLSVQNFNIVVPAGLPIQGLYTNDCVVFVASWMMNHEKENYMVKVHEGTRLRIVLDMVSKTT